MAKWTVDDIPDQAGRTVLVTGASSGLGLRSAEGLASRGARVLMGCRNPEKAAVALDEVKSVASDAAPEVVPLDLADLDDVRACAQRVAGELDHLDMLMNNAGVMAIPHQRTRQGFEMQFGTNHLGHFALTALLLSLLRRAHAPRVVTVSSSGHRAGRIRFNDLNWAKGRYSRWFAYTQSKLANLLFTSELQRRAIAAGSDLLAVAAHPGYAATNLSSGPATGNLIYGWGAKVSDALFGQSARMGALPQLYAATMPDVGPDDYWGPDGFMEQRGWPKRVGRSRAARDVEVARRLWNASEQLAGVSYSW
jgi:NAD(P)-dependent dehydrogenase (short-subunit alcohol dehydrogenase family)